MKNLFLIIILLFSQFSFSQNYYLLPDGNQFSIYQKKDNSLEKLHSLDFNYTELYAWDKDELVIVNNDSTKFHYGKIQNQKFEEILSQNFPEKFKINTIELKDEIVYLGGNWDSGELFYVFDVNSKEFHPVPIPKEVYQPGKAIDDILFLDEKIIVVDNIVEPKYLIEYSTKDLPKLKEGKVFELPINGTYEHIYKGNLNENYLVLLSETVSGYIGYSNHISVFKTNDFKYSFSINSRLKPKFQSPTEVWKDVLLVDDLVLVASKKNGIFKISIKENMFRVGNQHISKNKLKPISNSPTNPIKLIPFSKEKMVVIFDEINGVRSFQIIEIK